MNPQSRHFVSVVIPTFNGRELIEKNLPVLLSELERSGIPSEVIVIDDGSSDGTAEFVSGQGERARLIRFEENRGFRPAIEAGMGDARGDLVLLLNNDVEVCEGFLEPLIEHFQSEETFQAAPISLLEDRKTIAEGPKWACFRRGLIQFVKNHEPAQAPESAQPTFFASGGQTLLRKDRYLELGGFDDLYDPFYWEDVDLSYRAWKRGWRSIVEPRSVVIHPRGTTIDQLDQSTRLERVKQRNRLLFTWKNVTERPFFWKKHLCPLLLRSVFSLFVFPFHLRFYGGLFSALGRLPGVFERRKAARTASIIPDSKIFSFRNGLLPGDDR